MIYIRKEHYQGMIVHAQKGLPNEACGLLGGRIEGEDQYVEKVYCLTNVDESREHFSMDPREQFDAIKDMRKLGLQMIGNFHSHPETPARPSQEDKRLAYDPKIKYLILSLAKETPVLKAFSIVKGEVAAEEIIVQQ